MDAAALVVLLGLVTAVGWGIGDFWAAGATKKIGAISSALYVNAVGTVIYLPMYFLWLRPDVTIDPRSTLYGLAGGAVISVAMVLFYKGLERGPVSIVSPISAAYPMVITILALAVFDGALNGVQVGAIAIIVLGVMTASGLFTNKEAGRRIGKGPLLGIWSVLFYGTGFSLMAQSVGEVGWQTATLLQAISGTAVFAVLVPLVRGKERPFAIWRQGFTNRFVIGGTIAGWGAMIVMNIAFSHDLSGGAVAGAIASCYPVLTILLALKHFKEEFQLIPMLGAAASIGGVVILSLQ
jgi:drug/metabolite transporter (DMT)-like permease